MEKNITFWQWMILTDSEYVHITSESSKKRSTRSQFDSCASKHVCVVCNSGSIDDNLKYVDWGLTRCEDGGGVETIGEKMNICLQDELHLQCSAAMILILLLKGSSYNIFTVNLCYPRKCYKKFAESLLYKKMKFSIRDFFSECDQISSFLRIWSHLLKKPLMESFIFCLVLFFEPQAQHQWLFLHYLRPCMLFEVIFY